jgi:prephenate dehydrogenase
VLEITGFWEALGANVLTMPPAEHDAALAATSHLPHILAAALAAATPEKLLPLAASGWRDTTRVAAGDPQLWQPIFATNRSHVLTAMDRFATVLAALREALDQNDTEQLLRILEQARNVKSKHDALGD